mmetsp:Transcript_8830/g.16647  ORF Transcript_8830/g.16647 Transcript_8830/m.16647 type:complete len:81 (+) Transcript_8830:475-717(+)
MHPSITSFFPCGLRQHHLSFHTARTDEKNKAQSAPLGSLAEKGLDVESAFAGVAMEISTIVPTAIGPSRLLLIWGMKLMR